MQQLELLQPDYRAEKEAAAFVGLDEKTLRDLVSGHWQGLVPIRKHRGEVYYSRADLDGWKANNAQRKAGTSPANT